MTSIWSFGVFDTNFGTWKWYKECSTVLRLFPRMTASFLWYRKFMQRHLSISVVGKHLFPSGVKNFPGSLSENLTWNDQKWENMVPGSKKSQINQYKPFLDRKAYVLNSNAQKFLEQVWDFSLISTWRPWLKLHSAETEMQVTEKTPKLVERTFVHCYWKHKLSHPQKAYTDLIGIFRTPEPWFLTLVVSGLKSWGREPGKFGPT